MISRFQLSALSLSNNNNNRIKTISQNVPEKRISTEPEKNFGDGVKLKREIGLFSSVNFIIGNMIGSGIFISATSALERSGSIGISLIIWASCGLISLFGALAYAELGSVVPKSGAEYSYILEAFGELHPFWGPLPSFLCAWTNIIVLFPAGTAIICLTFAEYICEPLSSYFNEMSENDRVLVKDLIAVGALAIMTFINCLSVKLYIRLQNVFTISKLIACAVVIIGGIYYLCAEKTDHFSDPFHGSAQNAKDIALAFYSGLWAYSGWSALNFVTEEVKDPEKNILRSIVIALPLVTGIYFMINVAYIAVLTVPEMLSAPAVAVLFGDRILGPANFIIPLGVALSTFGCALSSQFGSARFNYAAGREGHMMEIFSYVHWKRLTPIPSVLFQGILSVIFIFAGNIDTLIDFSSFLQWIFFGFAMVALIAMRTSRREVYRAYRVPLAIPVIILFVATFLALGPVMLDPSLKYLMGVGLTLLGVIVYCVFIFFKFTPDRLIRKATYVIGRLLSVVPPQQEGESAPSNENNEKI